MTNVALDIALVLALVLGIASLGTSRLGAAIRYFSMQAACVAMVPLLIETRSGELSVHAWILFAATMVLKVAGVPHFLNRSLREASVRPTPRRPTKPTLGSKKRRLEGKKRRSDVKAKRGSGGFDD